MAFGGMWHWRCGIMLCAAACAGTGATALARGSDYTVLYAFGQGDGDAQQPAGALLQDKIGNLYGTTVAGGAHNKGAVFRIAADGGETVLHSFCAQQNCTDGLQPLSTLVEDGKGNLFGTDGFGGANDAGLVFEISNGGAETALYQFEYSAGEQPNPTLIRDRRGNLYGTTEIGGADNRGVIFSLAPDGSETVLHDFSGSDGQMPYAGLVRDGQGNFYGTTSQGGAYGQGEVFEFSAGGAFSILYSFTGGSDGGGPLAPVTVDSAGNLYGTTQLGGNENGSCYDGCGVVFKIAPDGTETVLYSFDGGRDGGQPASGLVLDGRGYLYGSTRLYGDMSACGGTGCGVVFQLAPDGSEKVLHRFEDGDDGSAPGPLVLGHGAAKGELLGMCMHGGVENEAGLAFMLKK